MPPDPTVGAPVLDPTGGGSGETYLRVARPAPTLQAEAMAEGSGEPARVSKHGEEEEAVEIGMEEVRVIDAAVGDVIERVGLERSGCLVGAGTAGHGRDLLKDDSPYGWLLARSGCVFQQEHNRRN